MKLRCKCIGLSLLHSGRIHAEILIATDDDLPEMLGENVVADLMQCAEARSFGAEGAVDGDDALAEVQQGANRLAARRARLRQRVVEARIEAQQREQFEDRIGLHGRGIELVRLGKQVFDQFVWGGDGRGCLQPYHRVCASLPASSSRRVRKVSA